MTFYPIPALEVFSTGGRVCLCTSKETGYDHDEENDQQEEGPSEEIGRNVMMAALYLDTKCRQAAGDAHAAGAARLVESREK